MKFSIAVLPFALVALTTISALSIPTTDGVHFYWHEPRVAGEAAYPDSDLWRRKGGGGGGSHGGGSEGGGSEGGSSSSGSSSSSSGSGEGDGEGSGSSGSSGSSSSSSSSGSVGKGSSSSDEGGSTTTGSGPRPAYAGTGGTSYYGGGASVPYAAGARSPLGISPYFLGAAALGFWSTSLWVHGAYFYPYSEPYTFYNASAGQNQTKPVECACDPTEECSCDNNSDPAFLADVVGNGSYAALNQTLVTVATVNGTSTILLNGTLPNGTTSSGGTDSPNAAGGMGGMLQNAAWAPMIAAVLGLVFFL